MHVLVAAAEQTMPGDYAWTVEGELVHLPVAECDSPACGCGRGFAGFASFRATSTARVADLDLTRDQFRQAMCDSLASAGWSVPGDPEFHPSDVAAFDEWVDIHLDVARDLPVGAIVERSGDEMWVRSHTP